MDSWLGLSRTEPAHAFERDRIFAVTGAIGGIIGAALVTVVQVSRIFRPDLVLPADAQPAARVLEVQGPLWEALLIVSPAAAILGALTGWLLVPMALRRFRRRRAKPVEIVSIGLLIGACVGAVVPYLLWWAMLFVYEIV